MARVREPRRYAKAWSILKTSGTIIIEITKSTNPAIFQSHSSTVVRALQKEKYLDAAFKRRFPSAKIISTLDPKAKTVSFKLELNDYTGLDSILGLP